MAKKNNTNQQLELFAPAFPGSIPVKDQQDLMQYPFFSLSKRKRVSPIRYDDGRVKIQVIAPEETGIANIFDADVLIYVASQLMEAHNKGLPTSPEIKVSKYDLLQFAGKATGGKSYKQLEDALRRLQSTSIETSIRLEDSDIEAKGGFSWIQDWAAIKKNGRPIAIKFRLSDWLYRGIIDHKLVLTYDRKYFELEGGLERFLYRLCRKVAGKDRPLQMKLKTVRRRSGSTRKPGKFRQMLEEIVEKQSIPEYWIFITNRLSTGDDYVCAISKSKYTTYENAVLNACSFIAMDRALLYAKRKHRDL